MAANPSENWAKISPARNWHTAGTKFSSAGTGTRYGEIDIVARSGGSLVFVEVKAREGSEFGGGEAAVTLYKQQRIIRMAIDFLARRELAGSTLPLRRGHH